MRYGHRIRVALFTPNQRSSVVGRLLDLEAELVDGGRVLDETAANFLAEADPEKTKSGLKYMSSAFTTLFSFKASGGGSSGEKNANFDTRHWSIRVNVELNP